MTKLSASIIFLTSCLWFVVGFQTSRADVIISEFTASNGATLADEDGDFEDWIELHNPTTDTVDPSPASLASPSTIRRPGARSGCRWTSRDR